ncbi:energy-coupling factor transporter ATPase, partial [Streptococcus suis]|nr:energy-coupling factor transporter ATPase [Streptococcus suis]
AIRQKYNLTVISITHDLDEVALSDRVIVMKNGKVESTSTPKALFGRGNRLISLGLDVPFTSRLMAELAANGLDIGTEYLTEKELEEQLWELNLKM